MNSTLQELDSASAANAVPGHLRDLLALTKPRITLLCLIMALGGFALAPSGGPDSGARLLWFILGLCLSAACANTLNMILERDTDLLMERTRNRPIAAGRLSVGTALAYALLSGAASIAILVALVNPVTAALSLFTILSYAFVYTPLKRISPHSLIVGAVPGAVPPLMGWTASSGTIDLPGLVLFLIVLVWQMPHFLAIAIYLKRDYAAAGMRTVPLVNGMPIAKFQAAVYAVSLVPVTLMLVPLRVAGWIYVVAALPLGIWFFWVSLQGFRTGDEDADAWARRLFRVSLVYLPLLTVGLIADRLLLS